MVSDVESTMDYPLIMDQLLERVENSRSLKFKQFETCGSSPSNFEPTSSTFAKRAMEIVFSTFCSTQMSFEMSFLGSATKELQKYRRPDKQV